MNYHFVPPEVLMGEAGICSIWAMIAVAYVFQRNPRMRGYQEPDLRANLVAGLWPFLPDLSGGAKYVFSLADLKKEAVKRIIKDKEQKAVFPCVKGRLAFYG